MDEKIEAGHRVMTAWTLDVFFGSEIEQVITVRDVDKLSDRLSRIRKPAA